MPKNELEKIWNCEIDLPYREKVEKLQQFIIDNYQDEVVAGDDGKTVVYPSWTKYNHYFSDGLYVREMFCVKGVICFTSIHNTANPLFLMKGKVAFSSEDGVEELTAPIFVLTKPGTKRMCYWIEDSVIVTVHPNPDGLTDLDKVEKKMFCGTWEQYDNDLKEDVWQMMEHKEYKKNLKDGKSK